MCGVRSASQDAAAEPPCELLAPVVVSAMDIKATFLDLLPAGAVPSALRHRVRGYEMPFPLSVLYLVLDRDLRAEGHPNTNTFLFAGDDIEAMYSAAQAGELPAELGAGIVEPTRAEFGAGISYASLADPDNSRLCRPGQSNLQVIAIDTARHDAWGVSPGGGRTGRFDARVKDLRDRLVALADRRHPGHRLLDRLRDDRHADRGGALHALYRRHLVRHRRHPAADDAGPARAENPDPRDCFLPGPAHRTGHGLAGTLAGGVAAAAAVTGTPMAELLASTPGGVAAVPAA